MTVGSGISLVYKIRAPNFHAQVLSGRKPLICIGGEIADYNQTLIRVSQGFESRCKRAGENVSSCGNQRDKDRERAQARNAKKGPKSGHNDALTPEQRRERDAKALQAKAARKAAEAAGQRDTESIKSHSRKK